MMMELIRRKPIVLHDFDDELRMARLFEALCPGEKARAIRADVERERAEGWPA